MAFVVIIKNDRVKFTKECKIVHIGHFRTILKRPNAQNKLAFDIEKYHHDANALILTGDVTLHGTLDEWSLFEKFLNKIHIPVYFAPGNHDVETSVGYSTWMKKVGYTSKVVNFPKCNVYLLNSVNQKRIEFTPDRLIAGGGLDDESIKLLKKIEVDKNKVNLLFMHHRLYSEKLWYENTKRKHEKFFDYPLENEKKWKEKIIPLIKNKIDAVFAGDNANNNNFMVIDNVPYFSNSIDYYRWPNEQIKKTKLKTERHLKYDVINYENNKLSVEIYFLPTAGKNIDDYQVKSKSNIFKIDATSPWFQSK